MKMMIVRKKLMINCISLLIQSKAKMLQWENEDESCLMDLIKESQNEYAEKHGFRELYYKWDECTMKIRDLMINQYMRDFKNGKVPDNYKKYTSRIGYANHIWLNDETQHIYQVKKKSDDEYGFWIDDAFGGTIIHCTVFARGVTILVNGIIYTIIEGDVCGLDELPPNMKKITS